MSRVLLFFIALSIGLHFVTFSFFNQKVKERKPKVSTHNKIVPIGYQQIKYIKLVKPKPKPKPKPVKTPKAKVVKPIKKPIIKPKAKLIKQPKIKKITKKFIKVAKSSTKQDKINKLKKLQEIKKAKEILKKQLEKQKEKLKDLKNIKRLDKTTQSYLKLYGEEYFTYSKDTKKYLNNNLSNIGKVTQMYLRYPRIAVKTHQQGMNIVEFYLYPNGDISNLKIKNSSGYSTLDKNTIKTIKLAYKDYPRPKEKTKIKIYVYYSLR